MDVQKNEDGSVTIILDAGTMDRRGVAKAVIEELNAYADTAPTEQAPSEPTE